MLLLLLVRLDIFSAVAVVVDETNILSVGPKLIRRHSGERCSEASRAPANRLLASRPSSSTLIFASLKRRLTQKTTSLLASLLPEVGFDVEAPEKWPAQVPQEFLPAEKVFRFYCSGKKMLEHNLDYSVQLKLLILDQ